MTDTEKLSIIRLLITERANMGEHVIELASMFNEHTTKGGSFSSMYERKLVAAEAVSGFCYELLDILHALDLKEG